LFRSGNCDSWKHASDILSFFSAYGHKKIVAEIVGKAIMILLVKMAVFWWSAFAVAVRASGATSCGLHGSRPMGYGWNGTFCVSRGPGFSLMTVIR
jgi:hypothetical protein